MISDTFKQTSSIINRLRVIMIIIALFFIMVTFALYLSSLSNLKGLQALNAANNLLNLSSQAIENLNTVERQLDKIHTEKDLHEIQYAYDENMKITTSLLNESLKQAKKDRELTQLLNSANSMVNQFDFQHKILIDNLFNLPKRKSGELANEISADVIVAKQFVMDAKDVLRKTQILVKQKNDHNFATIYNNRFTPLAVTISLSILFFIFVITYGLSTSRRIGRSVSNLLSATDWVSQGNLNYQVKILEGDEIGRLTSAFNKMINTLKIGQDHLNAAMDRTARLQSITASFSEALTPDQVYEVIFKQAFEALGAIAASISLLSEDKNFLELKRLEGYKEETFAKWQRYPVSADVPSAHAVRFHRSIFMETKELTNFGDVDSASDTPIGCHSLACLPLVIGSEAFGSISFSFSRSRIFSKEEKDFMIALSGQCAQAIHRSQLYDNAKKAIDARDEFLSIASHELRTPLTPLKLQIQGMARMVHNGNLNTITPERWRKMAETSNRQITRLSTLIEDLLDVSRITSGRLNLKKEYFSLKEIISEVIKQYTHYLSTTKSTTELVVERDSTGYWDKVRVEQVFINLLTNAAKYAPNKPIHITLSNENHIAKITVRDEGPGIAEADKDRIFKRFERVASRENVGGLGLGLYISKQIVEAHQGKIYVADSSSLGSIFTVELPEEIMT